MDFWQTVLVVKRRWYVAVPACVLAVAIAAGIYMLSPVQYVSNSVLVLTGPPTGGTDYADAKHPNSVTNPLLDFSQGQSLSASILIEALGATNVTTDLGLSSSSDTSFEVTNGSTNPELANSGPFVFVQGTSSSAAAAQDVVKRVGELARTDLAERQDELSAPLSTHISIEDVVAPTEPMALKGDKMRAVAAAGALCLLMSLAAVYAVESIATWRRKGRASFRRKIPLMSVGVKDSDPPSSASA